MAKTPKRSEIIKLAMQLYFEDCYKHGSQNPNNPEINELRESGYLATAQSELLRNGVKADLTEFKNYADQTENSENFQIDVSEALATGTYTCGSRNSGKSDLNMMIADVLMRENVIVLVFDPSMDWLKRSSISKYLTVQPYTKISIPNESMIYDLSVLTLADQKRFVENFNRALFDYQICNGSTWYFLIYEESHQYFPQGCMRAKAFQYSVRLLTQGRNFKISMGLITQFSSTLDKDTMKFMGQRFFGFSNEPNDLKYLGGFIDNSDQLKTLENGEFVYYHRNKISKINIEPYESDISKTQIMPNVSEIVEPIKQKQRNNNLNVCATMLMFMFWFGLAIYAISQFRGMI